MKLVTYSIIGMLLCTLVIGSALSQNGGDTSLRSFLPRFEEGTSRFINGDNTLWKQNASRRDDVTIMGGWGAYEKGWGRRRLETRSSSRRPAD